LRKFRWRRPNVKEMGKGEEEIKNVIPREGKNFPLKGGKEQRGKGGKTKVQKTGGRRSGGTGKLVPITTRERKKEKLNVSQGGTQGRLGIKINQKKSKRVQKSNTAMQRKTGRDRVGSAEKGKRKANGPERKVLTYLREENHRGRKEKRAERKGPGGDPLLGVEGGGRAEKPKR